MQMQGHSAPCLGADLCDDYYANQGTARHAPTP